MKVAFVIPSCRPDSLAEFIRAWGPTIADHALYVIEGDAVPASRRVGPNHLGWPEIEADLGADAWIISRRDSARRSYGFYRAWRDGADLIVTADDDTRPVAGQDYLAEHRAALEATPRWASPVPGFVPRGLPYRHKGTLAGVALSVGLWTGIPDQDAAHQLVAPIVGYTPPEGRWIIPSTVYHPLCGMNMAFRREITPLLYFCLMGSPWPYARFDDISGLLIAQRIMRHLGLSISVGRPWVAHERASDPIKNLIRESPGIAWMESFWPLVDAAPITASTPALCMAQMGDHLAVDADPYNAKLGEAIGRWAGLFAT